MDLTRKENRKARITQQFWKFFEKFNEANLCTWRILCQCTNCNQHSKLTNDIKGENPWYIPKDFATTTTTTNLKRMKVCNIGSSFMFKKFSKSKEIWSQHQLLVPRIIYASDLVVSITSSFSLSKKLFSFAFFCLTWSTVDNSILLKFMRRACRNTSLLLQIRKSPLVNFFQELFFSLSFNTEVYKAITAILEQSPSYFLQKLCPVDTRAIFVEPNLGWSSCCNPHSTQRLGLLSKVTT